MKDIQIALLRAKSAYMKAEELRDEAVKLISSSYGETGVEVHIDEYLCKSESSVLDIMTYLENFSRKC